MPQLIKEGKVLENELTVVDKDATMESVSDKSIVPKALFLEYAEACLDTGASSVWLDSDEGPEELEPYLDKLTTIAINFPKFIDGRGYSYARILRDRMGFQGEIRAVGDILHDQLFFLKRCGFNAFDIREDKDADVALSGLSDFSETYQAAVDQPRPLFRRR